MGQEQVRRNCLLLEVKYDMKVVHVEKMKLMDCVLNVLFFAKYSKLRQNFKK